MPTPFGMVSRARVPAGHGSALSKTERCASAQGRAPTSAARPHGKANQQNASSAAVAPSEQRAGCAHGPAALTRWRRQRRPRCRSASSASRRSSRAPPPSLPAAPSHNPGSESARNTTGAVQFRHWLAVAAVSASLPFDVSPRSLYGRTADTVGVHASSRGTAPMRSAL